MIGLVGMADRDTASKGRGGAWAILLVLLIGGMMGLPSPPPIDGRTAMAGSEAPWGTAKLPDPQAQTASLLLSAIDPSGRWRPSSAPWPESETESLLPAAADLDARHPPALRPGQAAGVGTATIRLAYESQGPPFLTR